MVIDARIESILPLAKAREEFPGKEASHISTSSMAAAWRWWRQTGSPADWGAVHVVRGSPEVLRRHDGGCQWRNPFTLRRTARVRHCCCRTGTPPSGDLIDLDAGLDSVGKLASSHFAFASAPSGRSQVIAHVSDVPPNLFCYRRGRCGEVDMPRIGDTF